MERAFQPEACDFSGWATRNDLKCSDGRVIRRDAFKHDDGIKVPLVWNHQHNDPRNVLIPTAFSTIPNPARSERFL